jgi:phosphate transport system substrate-binding protein
MKWPIVLVALAANFLAISSASSLDKSLPAYEQANGISGRINSVGSDSLSNEMGLWSKGFMDRYPDVKIEVEGKGSAAAPPALLDGTSQLGPMSRPMSGEEVDAFEKKYGYKPSPVHVAVDALAIYVHKDNPVPCLTLQQLNRIFSSTRKGPVFGRNIKTWGGVGLTGEWAAKPISMFGHNSGSDTYEYFRETVLYGGDYKTAVKEQVGSEAVVQGVASDKFAIGYSRPGYKTDAVRTVPLAIYEGAPCYNVSAEEAYSGKYPIARYLVIYLDKNPDQPLDALRSEFIKYVLSKDGQELTEKGGYYSITNDSRETDLKRLGIAAP